MESARASSALVVRRDRCRSQFLRWASVFTRAFVVATQFVLIVIPSIEPALFTSSAIELERSTRWRYGYVLRFHETVLVKAPRSAGEPVLVPHARTDSLTRRMRAELRWRPWKAIAELIFYATLVGTWKAGRRLLLILRADQNRLWWSASAALIAVLCVTLAMMPFLTLGYGEPSRFPSMIGPAVSYWAVLFALLALPLTATSGWLDATGIAHALVPLIGVRGVLWLLASLFWSVMAATFSWHGYRARVSEATG